MRKNFIFFVYSRTAYRQCFSSRIESYRFAYFFTFACKEVDTFTVILFPFFFLLFTFSPAIKYLFYLFILFSPFIFLRNLTFYLLAAFLIYLFTFLFLSISSIRFSKIKSTQFFLYCVLFKFIFYFLRVQLSYLRKNPFFYLRFQSFFFCLSNTKTPWFYQGVSAIYLFYRQFMVRMTGLEPAWSPTGT